MFRHSRCLSGQRWAAVLGACLLMLALVAGPAIAHEGHDHGDDQKDAAIAAAFPRIVARSASYELVGILKDGRWSITVDDAATNIPVTGTKLRVTIGDAPPVDADATGPGLFTIPQSQESGSARTVAFTLTGDRGGEVSSGTLPASSVTQGDHSHPHLSPLFITGGLVFLAFALGAIALMLKSRRRIASRTLAFASIASFVVAIAFAAWPPKPRADQTRALLQSDAPRRLADGGTFAAKPTQRLLDVRTAIAETATARPASLLIGRVIADPNRSSIVQSIYGGRVIASETALPRIGQNVAKGDSLVHIEPYLPVADRTTISEKVGEIEQLMAVAEGRLRRLRPLAAGGAVPASQISDLEVELEGLKARRETVMTLRANREILRAPTDGIITSASAVPGQVIQPQDVLFQIADPQNLWVEAFSYGDEPNDAAPATATNAGGLSFGLSFLGTSRVLRQHASIVHFAIPQAPAGLNIGQPVTVLVQSEASENGFVLPRAAIVSTSHGESIVWVHAAPERFEPRPVRTKPLDATRVLVASGLETGDRVVVRGADLINQIR